MTSDMLTYYREHRAQGLTHHAALKALSRRFDMDPDTAGRVIIRAERDEAVLGDAPILVDQKAGHPARRWRAREV